MYCLQNFCTEGNITQRSLHTHLSEVVRSWDVTQGVTGLGWILAASDPSHVDNARPLRSQIQLFFVFAHDPFILTHDSSELRIPEVLFARSNYPCLKEIGATDWK